MATKYTIEMATPDDLDPSALLERMQEVAVELAEADWGELSKRTTEVIRNEVSVTLLTSKAERALGAAEGKADYDLARSMSNMHYQYPATARCVAVCACGATWPHSEPVETTFRTDLDVLMRATATAVRAALAANASGTKRDQEAAHDAKVIEDTAHEAFTAKYG